jgi:hypothetical protein
MCRLSSTSQNRCAREVSGLTGLETRISLVFQNFGLFNFAGTFPELTENLGVSSAELTNRDSRSTLPDPTRGPIVSSMLWT